MKKITGFAQQTSQYKLMSLYLGLVCFCESAPKNKEAKNIKSTYYETKKEGKPSFFLSIVNI